MSELNEFSKIAFRLLDEINQQIEEGRDVASIPDIQEKIRTCAAGIHKQIRNHDAQESREHKPERYSQMSAARPLDECEESLEAFFDDVKAARMRHQIADVHVITRVIIEKSDSESTAMGFAHFGSLAEAESMCSWAMGRAIEKRRAYIARIGEEGVRHAKQDH